MSYFCKVRCYRNAKNKTEKNIICLGVYVLELENKDHDTEK